MSLEIGSVVEGVVTGITNFGAFVRLPEGNTGLIHISEIADAYVDDIRKFISEKDKLNVKVLGVNEKGKYDLSLKQANQEKNEEEPPAEEKAEPEKIAPEKFVKEDRKKHEFKEHRPHKEFREHREPSFEDKLSRYMKESEERLLDLKRNTESKRGKGRSR